jgi:hypothetical protein
MNRVCHTPQVALNASRVGTALDTEPLTGEAQHLRHQGKRIDLAALVKSRQELVLRQYLYLVPNYGVKRSRRNSSQLGTSGLFIDRQRRAVLPVRLCRNVGCLGQPGTFWTTKKAMSPS